MRTPLFCTVRRSYRDVMAYRPFFEHADSFVAPFVQGNLLIFASTCESQDYLEDTSPSLTLRQVYFTTIISSP